MKNNNNIKMTFTSEELHLLSIAVFNVVSDLEKSERHQDIYKKALELMARTDNELKENEPIYFTSEELHLLSIGAFSVVDELEGRGERDKAIYKDALDLLNKIDAIRA